MCLLGTIERKTNMANVWLPAACCVMDTCLLDTGELKVVEFNCINGSGFYDHDVKKIMKVWWEYHQ
jgi:ATP-grasp domain-containing protein